MYYVCRDRDVWTFFRATRQHLILMSFYTVCVPLSVVSDRLRRVRSVAIFNVRSNNATGFDIVLFKYSCLEVRHFDCFESLLDVAYVSIRWILCSCCTVLGEYMIIIHVFVVVVQKLTKIVYKTLLRLKKMESFTEGHWISTVFDSVKCDSARDVVVRNSVAWTSIDSISVASSVVAWRKYWFFI